MIIVDPIGFIVLIILLLILLLLLPQSWHSIRQLSSRHSPDPAPERPAPGSVPPDRSFAFSPFELKEAQARVIDDKAQRWGKLTPRERKIARLAADGKKNAEIAKAVGIKVPTVATHMRSIYKTLDCHSRAELANFLQDIGQ